jgi:hypothetical protein
MIQSGTGKTFTAGAVFDFVAHYFLAVFDTALNAGLSFGTVITPASGAWSTISPICRTKAAVHSAGSNERCANHVCLCRSFWHHVSGIGSFFIAIHLLRVFFVRSRSKCLWQWEYYSMCRLFRFNRLVNIEKSQDDPREFGGCFKNQVVRCLFELHKPCPGDSRSYCF